MKSLPLILNLLVKGTIGNIFLATSKGFWEERSCNHWIRIEIYVIDHTVWSGFYYDVNCSIVLKKLDAKNDFVLESTCLYLKGEVIPDTPKSFDLNSITHHNHILLEFQDVIRENKNQQKRKFKKLSKKSQDTKVSSRGLCKLQLIICNV